MSETQARRRSRKHITRSLQRGRLLPYTTSDSCQAALSSHPDKVPESERAIADVQFKSVSKAYEILYDDDKRHLYDTHGMQAFESGNGPGPGGVDLDDILAQMMGMGVGGSVPPGFRGGSGRPRKPQKGADEEQSYTVTLEELYKGKTVKFASTKNIICTHCKGSGGKEKAKPKQCASCQGQGIEHARLLPNGNN